jgi:hypothetical protein
MLVPEKRARQSLRFLSHPLWRAYTSTYVEGYRLLRSWLDARPAGTGVGERFVRLLDEPLTPGRLAAETAGMAGTPGSAGIAGSARSSGTAGTAGTAAG